MYLKEKAKKKQTHIGLLFLLLISLKTFAHWVQEYWAFTTSIIYYSKIVNEHLFLVNKIIFRIGDHL